MIENFIEYMWYLLTTPFKKLKKSLNQWYILCRVFGRRFDEIKEDILRARDEGMVATCSQEMLSVHGADRGLTRYEGEEPENFRSRISMYDELCKLGGTNEGVLLAVQTLGYPSPVIVRANDRDWVLSDEDRWAEFYIVLNMDIDQEYPIGFNILQKAVRKWKEVGAKDNYYFAFHLFCLNNMEDVLRMVLMAQVQTQMQAQNRVALPMHTDTEMDSGLRVEIKNNLFYLDGEYRLDGSKPLNTYEIIEEA